MQLKCPKKYSIKCVVNMTKWHSALTFQKCTFLFFHLGAQVLISFGIVLKVSINITGLKCKLLQVDKTK